MPSFNKITICGYLGRDVTIRYTPQGTAVADFSVATSEKTKVNGETQETTTWFKISTWAKTAEACNQYLSKGDLVYVEGRLRQDTYTDRDGVSRTSLVVNATDVQFLNTKGKQTDAEAPRAQAATAGNRADRAGAFNEEPEEQDIPF